MSYEATNVGPPAEGVFLLCLPWRGHRRNHNRSAAPIAIFGIFIFSLLPYLFPFVNDLSWSTASLLAFSWAFAPVRKALGSVPWPRHTKVFKNGSCQSLLNVQLYGKGNDWFTCCQYNVTRWGVLLGAFGSMLQWGSTIKSASVPRYHKEALHEHTAASQIHTHAPQTYTLHASGGRPYMTLAVDRT